LIEKIKIWKSRGKSEVSLKSSVSKTIPTPLCSSCIAKAKSIQKAQLGSNLNENDEIKVLRGAISLFESRTERSHEKVVNYLSPHEVRSKLFSADVKSMSLTSDLSNSKTKGYDMVELLRNIQNFSVDTSHPLFFNQLFGATDPIALAAELVALSVNTSAYTFETAPVFTMIERELIQNVGHLVFGQEIEVDGLVLPGGSLSNLTALHVARYYATTNIYPLNAVHQSNDEFRFEEKKIEDDWDKNKQFVAFVSSEAHYSFIKAIKVLGMGAENLIVVPTLENGQMDPNQLDLLMTQNRNRKQPFFVGLTAGSTVRGSFDDITAVVDVCRKHERQMDKECCTTGAVHKVWIHVDGAWGGPAIFSRRSDVRGLLNGIEYVDSFTFNPHKMLGAPQQTTIFVARHQVSLSFVCV
jgi:glutamate/tyrosine decarboxylase-like PLP-dependent enzyme